MLWTMEGYDTFANESYPLAGEWDTEPEVLVAAQERMQELEKSQPTESSGGQADGIQDQVYIVRPDGSKYRFM